jgi:hypothetical protein
MGITTPPCGRSLKKRVEYVQMKSKLNRLLPTLPIFLLLLLPAIAAARAGGGEGYSGGGGGGHGGGGGGGGGGFVQLIYFILFCVTHPYIGVPLLIIIAVACIYFSFQNQTNPPPANGPIPPGPPGRNVADAVDVIRRHDPAFNPDEFYTRVAGGFLKLQSAWCDQKLQQVRPFISDGIHERFSLQFAEQKAEGYRDQMEQVGIDRIILADANSDEIYDELAVEIRAHAADFKVSLRDGRPIAGGAPVEPFVEIWSFLRRRGGATVAGKPGLLEGHCPNCGAPISINESANCTNCNALLRSGQYDWVLSEITQASEWLPGGHSQVRGFSELRQRDPDLNIQSLEDRSSVIFWRKAAADRIGKIDPLFKVTSPAYAHTYAARLKPAAGQLRHYFGQCAVGAVEVIAFEIGTDESPTDRALIGVKWSGVRMEARPDGIFRPTSGNDPHHTLLVLMRKTGVKTDVAKGVSSAHCPNCGAPESGGTSGACEFCGTALNDGSNGWVLDNILSFNDPAAQQMVRLTS